MRPRGASPGPVASLSLLLALASCPSARGADLDAWAPQARADVFPPARSEAWVPFREGGAPPVEPLLSTRYAKRALGDLRRLATAPARWGEAEWLNVGIATVGVVATAAFLDEPIRDSIGHDPARSYGALKSIERLGEARNTIALLGVFYVGGLALDDDRAKAVALDGLISRVIASGLVTSNLKHAVGRARPYLERGAGQFEPFDGNSAHGSFPSGHATEAFAIASVIASEYPDNAWVRWTAYGLATTVGVARIKHDRHWTSDVVAGALIGSGVGRAVVRYNNEQRSEEEAAHGFTLGAEQGLLAITWRF